jgi:hypothetical protein
MSVVVTSARDGSLLSVSALPTPITVVVRPSGVDAVMM